MKPLRLALAAAAILALAAGVARAQTAVTTTFVAVDGIRYSGSTAVYYVTGVVQGEATAREVALYRSTSSDSTLEFHRQCERYLLLAMERPGQYLVTAERLGSGINYTLCSISRVNP